MPLKLIVDTNLLVLLVVGLTDRSLIARHKRLNTFDETDFDLVTDLVGRSDELLLIPNVVSETSNLARYLPTPMDRAVSRTLATMVRNCREQFIESHRAFDRPEYERLGVTDAALLVLHETGGTLLTDDAGLYDAAARAGYEAINYNHLREARPDFR